MKNLRSMLFMPGNNPGMLVSADILEADAIIYDLEDAVSIDQKDAARDLVSNALKFLEFNNSLVTVRINPIDSPFWKEDIKKILKENLDAIVIPKASVEAVKTIEKFIEKVCKKENLENKFRFYPLIESTMGILNAKKIAESSDRIDGLLLGGEDYCLDLGVYRTKTSKELAYARYVIAVVAKAYGINAIDTPYTDVEDFEGLIEETKFVKSIGFNGRLIVGPRQVSTVNKIFTPKDDEIEYAKAILKLRDKAEKEGLGVFSFKGKMVDKPVISRAENLIKAAEERGLI
ncbi:MAG: aldolase/citrate lyase family protein [Peptoniphilaceae bacterium]|nr:aldolase/citrate lyase family protein [Peptoniphilaceae bacterium]MDY6019547.1 aldolase/citrate lyase family protein [Anaerococcus sp.]